MQTLVICHVGSEPLEPCTPLNIPLLEQLDPDDAEDTEGLRRFLLEDELPHDITERLEAALSEDEERVCAMATD